MSWNVHIIQRKTKTYVSLKKNKRAGKKIISDYIYLGPAIDAVKMLTELQVKPLIDEREISYSGEIVLEKIADSIGLTRVLEKHTGDDRVARVLRNIILLRTIFPESKRKLAEVRLKHSILKDFTELKYLGEVYRFMDKIYNDLDDVMYDLVKNAIKNHSIGLEYLIIDATRIKIWKDRETGLVRFGYSSRNELKSLPQVNLVLGVSEQHIPLFAKVYPGNTQDVKMFDDFIHRINTRYKSLTRKVKEKFIIFDQGNVNEDNIKYLRKLQEQGIYFVSMMKTNSAPPPKNDPSTNGSNVPTNPSARQIRNTGIIITIPGIIRVERRTPKSRRLPGKLNRENPYATRPAPSTCPKIASPVTRQNSTLRRVLSMKQKPTIIQASSVATMKTARVSNLRWP